MELNNAIEQADYRAAVWGERCAVYRVGRLFHVGPFQNLRGMVYATIGETK